jgi:hypothetical protein
VGLKILRYRLTCPGGVLETISLDEHEHAPQSPPGTAHDRVRQRASEHRRIA